jgi:hypothetical protein
VPEEPPAGGYEAFISYRRGDGSAIARWLRGRLERYRLPAAVVAMLSPEKQALHRRRPRIYLDRAYEKPHADFLQEKLLPALDAAERLIVISTPSVFASIRGSDGAEAPNWLVQEVEHFLGARSADRPPRPIDLVIGPQGSIERFPGRLAERERWDWIDLRAFSRWRALGFSEALDAGFTKLAAAIYDVPDAALPLMRQEERRRRRRLVLGIAAVAVAVVAALGVLGSGWWAETRARQAVDYERRLVVARGLLDTGEIAKAVDTLASLARLDDAGRGPEARRLLAAWTARLATAGERLRALPDDAVFRWHGRNYLRNGDGLRLSFDGPPVLESALAHRGAWLVTFDADRRLRVRDVGRGGVPLLETGELDATTGTISEALDGRLILFEARLLSLQSDQDSADAQDVGGSFAALLDPLAGRYAIRTDAAGGGAPAARCDRVQLSGGEIELDPAQPAAGADATLLVRTDGGTGLQWELHGPDEALAAASPPDPAPDCAPRRLAALPQERNPPAVASLLFPLPRPETALWSVTGRVAEPQPGLDLCPPQADPEGATPAAAPVACYDASRATSIDPALADTLGTILRESETVPVAKQVGDAARLVVTAVLGNQAYGIALCAIGADRSLGRCLVATPTARSGTAFRLNDRLLVINGPEIHPGMFQLIDLGALRFVTVEPPPMERLADVAFSPDGTRMAALTGAGEAWLYAVDRERGTATILARHDFGGGADAPAEPPGNRFDSIIFAGGDRLLLAGRRGGVVLAEAASGRALWARAAPPLPGEGPLRLSADAAGGVVVLHDDRAAQLLTAASGILLSRVVDLAALAKAPADPVQSGDPILVSFTAGGRPRLTYRGVVIEPTTPSSHGLPAPADIARRTGIDGTGRPLPLGELLP